MRDFCPLGSAWSAPQRCRALAHCFHSILAVLMLGQAVAVETADYAVQVSAQVQSSPAQITLSWTQPATGVPSSYVISRKLRDATAWDAAVTLPGSSTSYTDSNVAVGTAYEYQVQRVASGYGGYGYIYAGIEVPATEARGKVILIVDNTHATDLAGELARLEQDLTGDGWTVLRHDVGREDSVTNVKALITAAYTADPANVKSVFLFGHVPVPYSGGIAPDGHSPDHRGAWPADLFYGEMDGLWTDTTINLSGASSPRNHNIPGDGRFDASVVPTQVKLQVGRVDLSNLPAFSQSEKELLRQYLNKDHNFRHKILSAERRGLVVDAFGAFNGEAFAASGWRNFAPLLGVDNVTTAASGGFVSTLASQSYLWAYGCGPGTYTSAGGIGSTAEFAGSDLRAVFTMLFGSYLGDWDSQDNFMRAVLAWPTHGLTCSWSGRPHWFYHHMGLGEPIGFSAMISQNNPGTYKQRNYGSGQIHVALLGDPTLRLHPVGPPTDLTATTSSGAVTLNWQASTEVVQRYHIYRGTSSAGPFTRLNERLVENTTYSDATVEPGTYTYQVRAQKLESSGSGTYFNLSQGAFTSATVAAPSAPPALPTVSVTAHDAEASEIGPDPGSFAVTVSPALETDLTIRLQFGGSAALGMDYLKIPSRITIPAGSTTAHIRVMPIADAAIEEVETVTLDLVADDTFEITSTAASATISLTDGPVVQRLKVRRR